jgi:hypothetical protein
MIPSRKRRAPLVPARWHCCVLASPAFGVDGGWQAGAGTFGEAAPNERIRQFRGVVKKASREPKARDGAADAAVAQTGDGRCFCRGEIFYPVARS